MPWLERHIFICTNQRDPQNPKGSCGQKGAAQILDRFKQEIYDRGLRDRFRVNAAGCLDQCHRGCAVVVYPEQVWYGGVRPEDVPEIMDQHILGGRPVARLLMPDQPQLAKVEETPSSRKLK